MIDYIKRMRAKIGHETLYVTGCGIIIYEKDNVLLQLRKDIHQWCIPGGLMELGETFYDCATREVFEETGIIVKSAELYGIYSGKDFNTEYPNGDKIYSTNIVFMSDDFNGNINSDSQETITHKWFDRTHLPENIVPLQKHWIVNWANGVKPVMVM